MTSPAELEQLEQLARSGATGPWMNEKILQLLADRRELVVAVRALLAAIGAVVVVSGSDWRASLNDDAFDRLAKLQALAVSMGEM